MAFLGIFGKKNTNQPQQPQPISDRERAEQEQLTADVMREARRQSTPSSEEDDKTIFDKMSDKYAKYSDMSKFKRQEEKRLQQEYDQKTRDEEKRRFVQEAEQRYKDKLENTKFTTKEKLSAIASKLSPSVIVESVNRGASELGLPGSDAVTNKINAMASGDTRTSAGKAVHELASAIRVSNPYAQGAMQTQSQWARPSVGIDDSRIQRLAGAELPRGFATQQPMTVEDLLGVRANLGSSTPTGQLKFQQFTSLGSNNVLVDELKGTNINTSKIETLFPRSAMSSGAFDSSKITALIMANQPSGVSTNFASQDRLRGLIAANTPSLRPNFSNMDNKLGLMMTRQPQISKRGKRVPKQQVPIIEDSTTRVRRLTGVNFSGKWL